ncbi:MAG: glycoside hydrolase family 2 TIM barrel-domain containing protein, partial [Gemmatimonadaceae bacterium]
MTAAVVLVARGVGAQVSSATPRLLAFADTSSVRVELASPAPHSLDGAVINGSIVSAGDSSVLWSGELGKLAVGPDGVGRLSRRLKGLRPMHWSPQSPSLYVLSARASTGSGLSERIRFGFRTMSTADGKLLLNGRAVFLRGNAINPPERNIPDSLDENRRFVEPYVRYMKSVGVNIIRLTRHSQVWFDVCDELGMMLFQGNYGTPQGGKPTQAPTRPLEESVDWYRQDVLGPLVNHPSVVVYVLTNEQADAEINYLTTGAAGVDRFLRAMYDSLHKWDDNRLYIANAGYGFGRAGDICDLHRYWGWYYNSFLSFYTMRDPKICWRRNMVQPMTMTENVGNYTGVDGRFNLVPATKQPDSQLNWTGHAPQSEQAERALGYQAWMAKQAIEIYRRSREQNPNLAGLTPFTIAFHNWWGISGFEDMKPKPIMRQYAVSYQPVLLSWESWSPNAYAGSTIRPVAHIVNDSEDGSVLPPTTLHYSLVGPDGRVRLSSSVSLAAVPYYGASSKSVEIVLPGDLSLGRYTLSGHVVHGKDTLSRNEVGVFIAPKPGTRPLLQVRLYDDRAGKTARALRSIGVVSIPVRSVASLAPSGGLLVIGAEAWSDRLEQETGSLRSFIARGGRVLILHQKPDKFDGRWLPAPIRLQQGELDHPLVFPGGRPFRNGIAVNPERPSNPVFDGIDRDMMFLWSDFTRWNEAAPGFPQVYPVSQGFVITDPSSLGRVAVLANYDHGLQGVALAEMFDGKGSVMVSGLDVVNRAGLDPVSDRMLANMIQYMSSDMSDVKDAHQAAPLIDRKITWGDYESEAGLLTGIYSGLLLNTVPVVPADLEKKYPISVNEEGYTFAGGTSGWNTKPAIQYVPRGRRVFGPYSFSAGGSVELVDKKGKRGEGRVWVRVPSSRTRMLTT